MSISYLNGSYIPKNKACVSVEDRGFNFADGIYEVIAFKGLTLLSYKKHISRLKTSAKKIDLDLPFENILSLFLVIKNLININEIKSGYLYIQITRGTAIRNHSFANNIRPNILINIYPKKENLNFQRGVKVITAEDVRWGRCDIKSISLLPNIMGKQLATNSGCFELWQVSSQGKITEGTTSNSFIVNKKNEIVTHPKNKKILGGVTRDNIIYLAKKNDFKVVEESFDIEQLYSSKEAFLTSTTIGILPVVMVNKKKISNGKVGCLTTKLRKIYEEFIENQLDGYL